jgi:hypothetical protein
MSPLAADALLVDAQGGMSDEMARALAQNCRRLRDLHVGFRSYSLTSELFTCVHVHERV